MPSAIKPSLIVRSQYGDESIALVQFLYENQDFCNLFNKIIIVYINTGWCSQTWPQRIEAGEAHAHRCGFESIRLTAPASFETLVLERKNFPSSKFQWCAGFLKGFPLLSWLDTLDPEAQWCIAIAKRQDLYRQSLPEYIESCEYHGERKVWHPILNLSSEERDQLLSRAGFSTLNHRSLECEPCVNSHAEDLKNMLPADTLKLRKLERRIGKTLFPIIKQPGPGRQNFSMGCGDFFGCGL